MRIHGYEVKFNREAAGVYQNANTALATKTLAGFDDQGATLALALDRGQVPPCMTGQVPMHAMVSGRLVGGADNASLQMFSGGEFGLLDGVNTASGVGISRAGVNGYYGAGRNGGGDMLRIGGALKTAIDLLDDPFAMLDGVMGTGEGPNGPSPTTPIYNHNRAPIWSGPLGFTDLHEDDVDEDEYINGLWNAIINGGRNFLLPNGDVVKDCVFAGICPTGTVYIQESDYGNTGRNGVPSDVSDNTRDRFVNHPSVFIRRKGAAMLREIMHRYADTRDIVTEEVLQPMGIYSISGNQPLSTWLMVFDGVPEVMTISHGTELTAARPKDIWNRVIVPICQSADSNSRRVNVRNILGDVAGTISRFKYLEFARYIGPRGDTQQDNTVAPA